MRFVASLVSASLFAVALCGTGAATDPAAAAEPVVREERGLVVDGVPERWRLQWTGSPTPACDPLDEGWFTCPCNGFAFGERGDLELLRLRDGQEVERLPLAQFFEHSWPAEGHQAILRRWNVHEEDLADLESQFQPCPMRRLRRRECPDE